MTGGGRTSDALILHDSGHAASHVLLHAVIICMIRVTKLFLSALLCALSRDTSDYGRCQLVKQYFQCIEVSTPKQQLIAVSFNKSEETLSVTFHYQSSTSAGIATNSFCHTWGLGLHTACDL